MFFILPQMTTPSQEIPILLEKLATLCLEEAAEHKDFKYRFSDHTCMDALFIFHFVCANRAVHKMLSDGIPLEFGGELAEGFGGELRRIFLSMTGIDPFDFFKKQ